MRVSHAFVTYRLVEAPPSPKLSASFTGKRLPSALKSYEALEAMLTAQGVRNWEPHVAGAPDNRKELHALLLLDPDGYVLEPEGQVEGQAAAVAGVGSQRADSAQLRAQLASCS